MSGTNTLEEYLQYNEKKRNVKNIVFDPHRPLHPCQDLMDPRHPQHLRQYQNGSCVQHESTEVQKTLLLKKLFKFFIIVSSLFFFEVFSVTTILIRKKRECFQTIAAS